MIDLNFNFDFLNNEYFFYERLVILFFSFVPALMLVGFVLRSDKKSKEPSKNILICLLSGILTISLAQFFERLVMPYFQNNVILTFIWATIEELSKISIFYLFLYDNKYYDDIYDGVVYMALIALSFAGLENIMYAFSESTVQDSISLAIMRDFTTIPLHVICGIVIGYFLSLGNFSKVKDKKLKNFAFAIIIPSLIHGTYNNLMSFLGSINVNNNNSFLIMIYVVIPLLSIMVALFYIAFKTLKNVIILNTCFIKNKKYDDNYSYLMNYNEYKVCNDRNKRIELYNKFNNKKKGKI